MTSNDRHSTFDSPYRTGRHVPLNGRDGLTSVATAGESRADLTSPYRDESGHRSTTARDGSRNRASPPEPNRPYSPGMRSQRARQPAPTDGFEVQSPTGEIPMQSFSDGMPPAPSVASSWRKIDRWAEENYPELFDQLCEGCTSNDLNDLEHQLDCSLPQDVRESLQIHDGQERGGIPTGIIFSAMILDCEEIVEEWTNWRKVNEEFLQKPRLLRPPVPAKAPGGSSSQASSSSAAAASSSSAPTSPRDSDWRQDLLARQDSVPPNSIQKAYAHPAWIPLVRDWGGNCLAVDLAPGPKGYWGQVVMFGRDYDTKYVVARSWAAFLAVVADDLGSGRWFVDEDSGELKLREFKQARVEPAYFDILRWRMDQKYGRTASKRKSMAPGAASRSAPNSPYAIPTEPSGEPRGRSMQRPNPISPIPSPIRPGYGKPSPLARVAEESGSASPGPGKAGDKLVEVDTPRQSNEENKDSAPRLAVLTSGETPADETKPETQQNGSAVASGKKPAVEVEEAMKTIEI
ncbi:cell wall assembly and cell proliferation coordinating protein [Parathielavia hyrcaniae]|uniref:Cell wall assembly and cell proliferation coordinating protein n=1 Tax=Parathielavia hyrcaniae TaxID=113614 RepID=A0AAN6Q798_9PEZI|nr:cell wall assembly and cell proliferation coordinating protein [Parathielavia hyrcaniae]